MMNSDIIKRIKTMTALRRLCEKEALTGKVFRQHLCKGPWKENCVINMEAILNTLSCPAMMRTISSLLESEKSHRPAGLCRQEPLKCYPWKCSKVPGPA